MSSISKIKPFVIEDGLNTSYIDSLFIALFYTPTVIESSILKSQTEEKYVYLQELIKDKFINVARQNNSISSHIVNEIRNYIMICGWLDVDYVCNPCNVWDFYDFLIGNLCNQHILISHQNPNIESNAFQEKKISYITLNIFESENMVSIKDLFKIWSCGDTDEVHSYVHNTPYILPFKIDRYSNGNGTKINTRIDIKKKIKLNMPESIYSDSDWFFHSAVCTSDDYHYYCLIRTAFDKWFIFDNKSIPCMTEVHMNDKNIIDKIMSECVFLIYGYRSRTV